MPPSFFGFLGTLAAQAAGEKGKHGHRGGYAKKGSLGGKGSSGGSTGGGGATAEGGPFGGGSGSGMSGVSGMSTSSGADPFEVAADYRKGLLSTGVISRAQSKQIEAVFDGLREGAAKSDSRARATLCDLVRTFLVPGNWADGSTNPCECGECEGEAPNPQMCEADFLGRWNDLK